MQHTALYSVHDVHEVITGIIFSPSTEWGADVDAYVVRTNYNEYAIVMMSKTKSTGVTTTSLKLYSECTGTFHSFTHFIKQKKCTFSAFFSGLYTF